MTQRGFLTYYGSEFVESIKDDTIEILNQAKLGKALVNDDKLFHYNLRITEVYNKLEEDERIISNFSFRESAISAVLSCFNTGSFFSWCEEQKKSKFLTTSHKRLIMDTLRFIASGERAISIETQLMLTDTRVAGEADFKTEYILSNYFKSGDHSTDYWRCCNYPNNSLPFDLANIIAKWTSQPTGFKDMIIFAYIVFGKDERNDIVNKRFY